MSARFYLVPVLMTLACAGGGVGVPIGVWRVPPASGDQRFCGDSALQDSTLYDTTQVTQRPVLYDAPSLKYPRSARARGVHGRVLLAVTINRTGRADAQSIEALSSPDVELTQAAVRWVRGARFEPACLNRRPVRIRVAVPVDFPSGS
jgi:TonB family protein